MPSIHYFRVLDFRLARLQYFTVILLLDPVIHFRFGKYNRSQRDTNTNCALYPTTGEYEICRAHGSWFSTYMDTYVAGKARKTFTWTSLLHYRWIYFMSKQTWNSPLKVREDWLEVAICFYSIVFSTRTDPRSLQRRTPTQPSRDERGKSCRQVTMQAKYHYLSHSIHKKREWI